MRGVSVTTDIWTDKFKRRSYLGVILNYIDCGILEERTLAVKEIVDKCAENIFEMLQMILSEYSIDLANVVFVTDRGGESKSIFHHRSL